MADVRAALRLEQMEHGGPNCCWYAAQLAATWSADSRCCIVSSNPDATSSRPFTTLSSSSRASCS
jgi:hypothetical protein